MKTSDYSPEQQRSILAKINGCKSGGKTRAIVAAGIAIPTYYEWTRRAAGKGAKTTPRAKAEPKPAGKVPRPPVVSQARAEEIVAFSNMGAMLAAMHTSLPPDKENVILRSIVADQAVTIARLRKGKA